MGEEHNRLIDFTDPLVDFKNSGILSFQAIHDSSHRTSTYIQYVRAEYEIIEIQTGPNSGEDSDAKINKRADTFLHPGPAPFTVDILSIR